MKDSPWQVDFLEFATACAFACLPSPTPTNEQLRNCKLVGHRGAHINTPFTENTLDSFLALVDAGVWGAEMDIRWTKDLIPVISHDADCQRLFSLPIVIAETNFSDLRQRIPQIPSLQEVVSAVGQTLHLMLEIKAEPYPNPQYQTSVLQAVLEPIRPTQNYHLLALNTDLFSCVPFAPAESKVLVSIFNTAEISLAAKQTPCGGIAGAYPFFTKQLRRQHRALGHKIGTGHIDSQRLLFQQIALGTDWIFSNQVLKLQKIINKRLEDAL